MSRCRSKRNCFVSWDSSAPRILKTWSASLGKFWPKMRWIWLKNCWYLVTQICCGWYFKQYISKGNFTFLYDSDLPSAGKSWNYLWAVPRIPSLRRCHGISSKSFSPREFVDLMSQGKKSKCIYFFRRWKKDSRTGTAKSKTSKKIYIQI